MRKSFSKELCLHSFFLSPVVGFEDLVGGHSYYLDKQKELWTRREAKESKIKRIFYWLCSGEKKWDH